MPPKPKNLGELAVQKGWASLEQLEECLRVLQTQGGSKPRLGELLVQRGILSKEQVTQLLALQSKELFLCSACARRYNVVFWTPGRNVFCPRCNGLLIRLTAMKGIGADETLECE
jgi:hypothetical protein